MSRRLLGARGGSVVAAPASPKAALPPCSGPTAVRVSRAAVVSPGYLDVGPAAPAPASTSPPASALPGVHASRLPMRADACRALGNERPAPLSAIEQDPASPTGGSAPAACQSPTPDYGTAGREPRPEVPGVAGRTRHLFFTRVKGFALPVPGGQGVEFDAVDQERASKIGLMEDMPFVLREDGSYDPHLNRWLRSLSGDGAPAKHTWTAYARDALAFAAFMEDVFEREWHTATKDDLQAYHRVRRSPESAFYISAESWNRALAALERLFHWARDLRLVADLPFSYELKQVLIPGEGSGSAAPRTVTSNKLKTAGSGDPEVKFLSPEDYSFFRDVGLRGRLPDGSEDPSWTGRNGFRDAGMADLLVTAGLRIEEASCFLAWELPPRIALDHATPQRHRHRIPPEVAKRERARDVYLSYRVCRLLDDYARTEREGAIARWQEAGLGKTVGRWGERALVRVLDAKSLISIPSGDRRSAVRIAPEHRIHLVEVQADGTEVPGWFFLAESGAPLGTRSWNRIFTAASRRCTQHGRPLHVTPHRLRHTYAVHLLARLIEKTVGRAVLADLATAGARAYQRVLGDPLRILQRRMGHRRLASTFVYLDTLREAQDLADDAVEAWDRMVARGVAEVTP